MELLDERWTLLIVRELVTGSEHFNELRRGVPRVSPTLLSKRLSQLVRASVVDRHDDGKDVRYVLTPAGRELRPVVEALGVWGIRWIGELGEEDLDPHLLLWDMHRNIDHDAVPARRTVIQFRFLDIPANTRDWWLVITRGNADVCDADPGFPVAVTVTARLRRLVEIWRGTSAGPRRCAPARSPWRAPKRSAEPYPDGSRCPNSLPYPGRRRQPAGEDRNAYARVVHRDLKKPHWIAPAVRAGSHRPQRGFDAPSWPRSRPGNQHPPAQDLAAWVVATLLTTWARTRRAPGRRADIRSYRRDEMTFMSWQIRRGVVPAPAADRPSSIRILMALSALPQPPPNWLICEPSRPHPPLPQALRVGDPGQRRNR